jgi:ribose transport system permease protein
VITYREQSIKSKALTTLRNNMLIAALLLFIVVVAIIEPKFLTYKNILNALRQATVIGACAMGVTLVMIDGCVDLSVGGIVSLCSVIGIYVMNTFTKNNLDAANAASLLAIFSALLVGFLAGMINGLLMAFSKGKMGQSIVITYSSRIIFGAIALLVVDGRFQTGYFPDNCIYGQIGLGYWPIIIFLSIFAIIQWFLMVTGYGRKLYFMGTNIEAARMSGIKINKIRIINFAISGLCSAVGAILVTSRVASASPTQGTGYELMALSSAVVGGVSLAGGAGNARNTLVGVIVIAVLGNALNVIGVSAFFQHIIRGAIIVLAVLLDVWNKRIFEKEVQRSAAATIKNQ